MPENTGLGLAQTLLLWLTVVTTWLGGETGRVIMASGMGGFIRWLSTDRKRVRDGIFSVIGGAIAGIYLWPAILWALGMDHTPDSIAMAAFVAGTIGISFVKVVSAVVESRAHKHMGDKDAEF